MPDSSDARVAVYIDFDNIVISRYAQVHPENSKDQLNAFDGTDALVKSRLASAAVDIDAILDYASSFGTIVISRAYADWSRAMNSRYKKELIARAVDLTQLFPTSGTKNGADIRLAVDVVEDTLRLPAITHVVVVAGDSDYIPLAQRAKRLNTYVVGIGVAGSTSKSLAEACNEFTDYDALPGVAKKPEPTVTPKTAAPSTRASTAPAAVPSGAESKKLQSDRDRAASLLERALRLGHEKDDAEWLHSSEVKNQMKRMDPKYSEKAIGYSSFMDFVKSRSKIVEIKEEGPLRYLKLKSRG
jgi:uncharacterized LabA/DUF88 family protein